MNFQQLETREKWMVAGGALLALVLLVYEFAWLPLSQAVADQLVLLQKQTQSLQMLEQIVEQYRQQAPQQTTSEASQKSVFAIIEETATNFAVRANLQNIASRGNDRLQVRLDSVAFDSWVAWTAELSSVHALQVSRARLQALDNTGLVDADVVYTR